MLRIKEPIERPSILVLNRSYWPDAEATGQLLTELCEDLASQYQITVIAGQTNQNPTGVRCRTWGAQEHNGVTIRRVPHLKLGKKFLWARGLNMLTYFAGAAISALFPGARPLLSSRPIRFCCPCSAGSCRSATDAA